ncbi:MAG: hypothetical protein IPK58_05245 [Acidobacteria bacterium]|nr:hypothetical protein [Acidobacteriota bacterium]
MKSAKASPYFALSLATNGFIFSPSKNASWNIFANCALFFCRSSSGRPASFPRTIRIRGIRYDCSGALILK